MILRTFLLPLANGDVEFANADPLNVDSAQIFAVIQSDAPQIVLANEYQRMCGRIAATVFRAVSGRDGAEIRSSSRFSPSCTTKPT